MKAGEMRNEILRGEVSNFKQRIQDIAKILKFYRELEWFQFLLNSAFNEEEYQIIRGKLQRSRLVLDEVARMIERKLGEWRE